MQLSDFQFDLPAELIACYPLPERSASRLLCLEGNSGVVRHQHFRDLLNFITPKDLLVLNNSRVIPARLRGQKTTGGHVEILIERIRDSQHVFAQIRASKTPRPNSFLHLTNGVKFEVLSREDDLYLLRCDAAESVLEVIEAVGEIPLPPYFQRAPETSDKERYQTVYADPKGSVAAPTAGLHFDAALLKELAAQGVEMGYLTLHVGAGTFAPVRVEQIENHRMHSEVIEVPAQLCEQIKTTKARGGRVIAVGTTTARSLETASRTGSIKPFTGTTDIFIYPGFEFHCVDMLITNFHTPGSTLLMLVSAFAGYENIMRTYREAVAERYRFFSYGDAMLLTRRE